jgi:GAF domain-containing protein
VATEHDEHHLAQTLSSVARRLVAQPDVPRTLEEITTAAVATVPGAECAGLTLMAGRSTLTAHAPTHDVVQQADRWQVELNEGPCLDVIRDEQTVFAEDLSSDRRWPRFTTRAAAHGVRSLISLRLFVEGLNLGALNLYTLGARCFGQDARVVGELFATHAAVALFGAKRAHNYTSALTNRDVIGQAKGLLMAREDLTAQQAFERLVRGSQQSNIKLAEVAAWLVREHESPGQAPRPHAA